MTQSDKDHWECFEEMIDSVMENRTTSLDEELSVYLKKSLSIRKECEKLMKNGVTQDKLHKLALRGLYYLYLSKRCKERMKEEQ